jgi:hypothetical protein
VHRQLGNFAKAQPALERQRELRKQILGEDHREYAEGLVNLGIQDEDKE